MSVGRATAPALTFFSCPFFIYQVFLKCAFLFHMNFSQQLELTEKLLVKRAVMEKVISDIKAYRPFDAGAARGAMPYTGIGGAIGGAAIGAGSALLSRLMGHDDEEDPSVWKRALIGSLIGGGLGTAAPLLGPAAVPHMADFMRKKKIREANQEFNDAPIKGNLAGMKRLYGLGKAELTKPMIEFGAPHLTVEDIMEGLQDR